MKCLFELGQSLPKEFCFHKGWVSLLSPNDNIYLFIFLRYL